MLTYNKQQQRLPIGGHHYSSHGIMFRADSFEALIDKLKAFRLANAIPLGDPEQDILFFYAKNYPWLVISDDRPTKSTSRSDANDWIAWVRKAWINPPNKFRTLKEARLRWEICDRCPFNLKPEWTEDKEIAETKRRAFMLRRGFSVPDELGYCSLHKADLSVLVFIDNQHNYSSKKDEDKSPGYCWV